MKENDYYIIKMKEWSFSGKKNPGYTAIVQIIHIDWEYKGVKAQILNVLEDKENFLTDDDKEGVPRTYLIEDFQKNSEYYSAEKITPKLYPEYFV